MILSKLKLVENIVNEISDNSTGQISPYDIRHNLLDIIDSIHLLTIGKPLSGSNFATISTRTTKVGESTLENLGLQGYFSVDNSAVGYSALKSNYQGVRNTAVGSQALSCNIYGDDNVAIGHTSLGSNTVGIGNVGIGNYALNYNRGGNFNVAIGHGAGYFVENNTSNKLYIASHAVNDQYICENPVGSGLVPLMHGDFSSLQLGVGVSGLRDYGTLQVNGDIVAYNNLDSNLGHPSSLWNIVYAKNIKSDNDLIIHSNILPISGDQSVGSPSSRWNSAFFNNINVSGRATINNVASLQHLYYFHKNITLGASGSLCCLDGGGAYSLYDYAYQDEPETPSYTKLTDQELANAGLLIESSGLNYLRNYHFIFLPPDNSLTCLQQDTPYSRASWNSNISLHIASGSHLRTDRVIFPNAMSLVYSSGCRGLFSVNNKLFLARQSDIRIDPTSSSGLLAGVGEFNFFTDSGNLSNYFISIASLESGVTVGHRYLTGSKTRIKDSLNNNKDRINGFEAKYIDDSSTVVGGFTDRFIVGSYNRTSEMVNALSIMKDSNDEGIVGITNLAPLSQNILPETSLNIRSKANAIIRVTAENQSNTKSSLQLLGASNCLQDGLEIEYSNASGLADLSMYKDSGKSVFFRLYENNTVGLFTSSGSSNAMFTMGDSVNPNAVISLRQANSFPAQTANYGKIYIRPKAAQFQAQSLYLTDGSGNIHDLIVNKFDVNDGRAVYTDDLNNTFVGLLSPDNRNDITSATGNVSLGSRSLFSITTGDNNTVVGTLSGSGISTGSNNIVLGNQAYRSSNGSNNIIIGNNGLGNNNTANYQFLLGDSNSSVLMQGTIGPTNADKQLSLPSGGKLNLRDNTNTDALSLRTGVIEVVDGGGNNYPDNTLSFKFTGNNSADLLVLNHNSVPLTNSTTYAGSGRPFAQFNSDVRVQGFVRFNDGTSLASSSFLNDVSALQSGVNALNSTTSNINSTLSSLLVEGYVTTEIKAPTIATFPTNGVLVTKNNSWANAHSVTITNRDVTSPIHSGAYVIALRINNEYRPIWISNRDGTGACCIN
jgi:hypothetical protein